MQRGTEQFWQALLAIVDGLDRGTYYDLLHIERTASPEAIGEAYYGMVRVFHPDRFARERDRVRTNALVRVFARIGEAYRTLINPALREKYDELLLEGITRLPTSARSRDHEPKAQRDPKSNKAWSLLARGIELASDGDAKGARAQYQLALQFEPGSRAILNALASVAPKPAAGKAVLTSVPMPESSASSDDGLKSPARPKKKRAPTLEELLELLPEPPDDESAEWTDEATRSDPAPPVPTEIINRPAKREYRRQDLDARVHVKCQSWAQLETLYTQNVSRGGMFLRTKKPVPVGTTMELGLTLPDGQQVTFSAVVRRVVNEGDSPGVGVQFVGLDVETRAELEILLLSNGVDVSERVARAGYNPPTAAAPPRAKSTQPPADRKELSAAGPLPKIDGLPPRSPTRTKPPPPPQPRERKQPTVPPTTIAEPASKAKSEPPKPPQPNSKAKPPPKAKSDPPKSPPAKPAEAPAAVKRSSLMRKKTTWQNPVARAGRAALLSGAYDDAVTMLDAAISDDPDDANLRITFHLAAAYGARKRRMKEKAKEHLEKALFYDPNCQEAIDALRDS